uniref:Uncharacterized protein n=1 Tax=Lotharella oceanica TaxID=641309 RepID=A0A7S2TNX9_9EUKA
MHSWFGQVMSFFAPHASLQICQEDSRSHRHSFGQMVILSKYLETALCLRIMDLDCHRRQRWCMLHLCEIDDSAVAMDAENYHVLVRCTTAPAARNARTLLARYVGRCFS